MYLTRLFFISLLLLSAGCDNTAPPIVEAPSASTSEDPRLTSNPNPIPTKDFSLLRQTAKVWSWKLLDEDVGGQDFVAALDLRVGLDQMSAQGRSYWVVNDLVLSPQSIRGVSLEVTRLRVNYREENSNLVMTLELAFRLMAKEVNIPINTEGFHFLNKGEFGAVVQALTTDQGGIATGFSLNRTQVQSAVLPEEAPTIFRTFRFVNKADQLTVELLASNPLSVLKELEDPGLDGWLAGGADWKVVVNDEAFGQPIRK